MITVAPNSQQSFNFLPGTGLTKNYDAVHSPVNGSTISQADEDGVRYDCYLWNDQGKADPSGFTHDETYPYAKQAQVHYVGSGSDPLEFPSPPIAWDMRTVIDVKNNNSATAFVNYNHTCYPAHQVKVNGQVVYSYMPPSNDITYIAGCLFQVYPKIVGQQSVPAPVPVQ